MNILIVAPSLPYPPNHAQRLRTWHLATRLAHRHRVTLVTWAREDTPSEHRRAVESAFADVAVGPLRSAPSDLRTRLGRHRRFLLGGAPTYVQAMRDERGLQHGGPGHALLAEAIVGRDFDVAVLEDESLPWLPIPLPTCPLVIHRLNVFERVVGDIPVRHPLRRLAKPLEMRGWRRFEQRAGEMGDALVAPTPESAAAVARISPGVPVDVVTSGVELPPVVSPPSEGHDLAFVGWMGYPPNADAAEWFVTRVWPLVSEASATTRFRIVGRNPIHDVVALANDRIVVTGEVPDVVEACRGVRVGVVPLRAGMGIKTKTIELLAMGLPVVSTTVGAEGIAATEDEGLIVRDDPEAFAGAVRDLLSHPEEADRLGAGGREFVRRHFDWDTIATAYERILATAASRVGG